MGLKRKRTFEQPEPSRNDRTRRECRCAHVKTPPTEFSHVFYLNSSRRVPPSGQPESFTKASQVGESHECLKVLKQATFQTQKIDEGSHSLVDLEAKGGITVF